MRLMWVGGQRHAPAALPPGKRLGIHFIGGWMGTRVGLDGCRKFCPQWDSIPGPSCPVPVALPTELSRSTSMTYNGENFTFYTDVWTGIPNKAVWSKRNVYRTYKLGLTSALLLFSDGKYHMLPSGELMILNITASDAMRSYRCRTHHQLTQEAVVSRNVGRIQMTGEWRINALWSSDLQPYWLKVIRAGFVFTTRRFSRLRPKERVSRPKYWQKDLRQYHFVHHKSDTDCRRC